MRVRIIYGKLRPGAWDGYEAAYKEVMGQAGQIPGLSPAGLPAMSIIPMLDIPSAYGRTKLRCAITR